MSDAIGTASLRLGLLPEPYNSEVAKLLRQNLYTRIAYREAATDTVEVNDAIARAKTEQRELWSEAVTAVKTNPSSPLYALFISSLNDAFDLEAKRTAARENHVPAIVFYLLFFVGAVSMLLVGLGGVGNRRHLAFTASVSILICLVILVIIDLDRPRRGLIEVSQDTMIALRNSLE